MSQREVLFNDSGKRKNGTKLGSYVKF